MNSTTALSGNAIPEPVVSSTNSSAPAGEASMAGSSVGKASNDRAEKLFNPLVRQFLDYLKLEKHFSDYTVKSYGADLIQFCQFLAGEIGPAAAAVPAGANPPK